MRCSCSRDSRHKTGSEVQHPCGASMAAVAEALERTQVSLDFKAVHRKEQPDFESEAGAGERARTFARRLGDSLCELARRDHRGIFWASAYGEDSGLEQRYLTGGSAGVLLALAELVAELGEGRHREALIEGIEWLENSKPVGTILPGLYVGELGVAAALLRAGQVLNRPDLVSKAANIVHAVAAALGPRWLAGAAFPAARGPQ